MNMACNCGLTHEYPQFDPLIKMKARSYKDHLVDFLISD